jgi:hypothetical protein
MSTSLLNLQVASPDIFGRYFQLSTPVGTVSEETMKVLMSTLSQVEAFADNLKKIGEEGKLRNTPTRTLDYLGDLDENQRQNLVIASGLPPKIGPLKMRQSCRITTGGKIGGNKKIYGRAGVQDSRGG